MMVLVGYTEISVSTRLSKRQASGPVKRLTVKIIAVRKTVGLMFDTKRTVWRSLLGSGACNRGRREFKRFIAVYITLVLTF